MDMNWILDEYDGFIYVSDMENYEVKYLNKKGRQLCGVTQEEIANNAYKCYQLLQGEERPCSFCTNSYLKDNDFYEWEHYNPHLARTFLLKDRKLSWNGRDARIEFATDISAYRDRIASKERERDSVLKSLPGGIVRVDARDFRTVLWYGANFLSMIGYTKEQFRDELHHQCTYVHPDDLEKVTEIMSSLKESGQIVITEIRIIARDKSIRTLTATFSYEDGESSEDGIPSVYSVGIDITQIKKEQENQRRVLVEACHAAQTANQAKTDFLSRMSHDIRTPMNAILGMAALAEANINNQEKAKDYLRKINTSGKYLLALINEVLDMSKMESGSLELVQGDFLLSDLVQNVMDVCISAMKEKEQSLNVHVQAGIHEKLYGDMERLQQVFVNILSNASKYTQAGGDITLTISEKSLHIPDVMLFEFVFADNGIGMNQEFKEHIFEPFTRAEDSRISKIQGTGLGMAISQNIIHLMNGSLTVKSELYKGSRFTVTVPLKLQKDTDKPLEGMTGKRVLAAGENQEECENVCNLLNNLGMVGSWVLSGSKMVEEILLAQEKGEGYSAVLIDWKELQPEVMTAAKKIQAQLGLKAPVMIAVAYNYAEISEELIEAGITFFVSKPLFRANLLQIFKNLGDSIENKYMIREDKKNRLEGKQLLIVEDNALNLEIVQELLKMQGALTDTACDGREAVEKFRGSRIGHYDAILMDIQMPVMNGYEASVCIRAMQRKDAATVPIIALTANAFSEDMRKAREAGMNEHLTKPVDADKMFSVIEQCLIQQHT